MTDRNTQLIAAIVEDRAARAEAFQAGLLATKPHSAARIAQLCVLGERMMQTALRKQDAERDVSDATIGSTCAIDYVIPA